MVVWICDCGHFLVLCINAKEMAVDYWGTVNSNERMDLL